MSEIRAATLEDKRAVSQVHVRSWQVGYQGLIPDDYLRAMTPQSREERYTFGSDDPTDPLTMVAVDREVICGFATVGVARVDDRLHEGELLALYVDPAYWGRGFGRRLIAHARGLLCSMDVTTAVLWVLKGNQRAIQFYERDGWSSVGATREENVWDVVVDELRYTRALP